MAREYRAISADSHLEVPGDRWEHRVAAKYRHLNPKRISLPGGGEAHQIEGQPMKVEPGRDFRKPGWRGVEPRGGAFATNDGGGPPEKRLQEQDIDGVDAEALFFGTTAGANYWREGIRDDDAYCDIVGAYNGWLAEEYCAGAPDRLIGIGLIPEADAESTVAELEHCKRLGLKAVQLNRFPGGEMYPTREDDDFWAAAAEMGMPLTVHVEFGNRYSGPLFQYEKGTAGADEIRLTQRSGRAVHHALRQQSRARRDEARLRRRLRPVPLAALLFRRNAGRLDPDVAAGDGRLLRAQSHLGA